MQITLDYLPFSAQYTLLFLYKLSTQIKKKNCVPDSNEQLSFFKTTFFP